MTITDAFNRPLRDLRISVTDRCNFRCAYCMPKEIFGSGYPFLKRDELLSFEEITRLVRIFKSLGVRKVRLTGGEPLLRHKIEVLVGMLAEIGDLDLAMTTNGSLLAKKAAALREAGLNRLTISLDSLDDATFRAMNDVDFPVDKVLEGVAAAEAARFGPLKFNMVVKRGVNHQDILPMAKYFRGSGHVLRFIEFMDVGNANGWRLDDVFPAAEIIQTIHAQLPLEPIDPNYPGEVAKRWRYKDGGGEIGLIASVTQPFCGGCSRIRLSVQGELYTCLFGVNSFDLRQPLRENASDAEIRTLLTQLWAKRADRYSEVRASETPKGQKVEMFYIGG